MYNEYINEKKIEKLEYDINLFKEYLIIYTNLLIKFPKEFELRSNLTNFIKDYYKYSMQEYKLLNIIKKINIENLESECCLILEELERMFEKQFNYNEDILNGYEEAIFYEDKNRAIITKKKFNNIIEEKEMLKRLNIYK